MPPKPKFTRNEIIAAALKLVSEKGVEALTARELGSRMGSSARPIFTLFKNMEELQAEVRRAAMNRFEAYAEKALPDIPRFKQIGLQMVRFAIEEPKLYQLLFMQEQKSPSGFESIFGELGETADICMETICRDYGLSLEKARLLFENMWIYTFGIGALCATGACRFTGEQLSEMLSMEFQALMTLIIKK